MPQALFYSLCSTTGTEYQLGRYRELTVSCKWLDILFYCSDLTYTTVEHLCLFVWKMWKALGTFWNRSKHEFTIFPLGWKSSCNQNRWEIWTDINFLCYTVVIPSRQTSVRKSPVVRHTCPRSDWISHGSVPALGGAAYWRLDFFFSSGLYGMGCVSCVSSHIPLSVGSIFRELELGVLFRAAVEVRLILLL